MVFWNFGRSKSRPDVQKNENQKLKFGSKNGLPEFLVEANSYFEYEYQDSRVKYIKCYRKTAEKCQNFEGKSFKIQKNLEIHIKTI